MGQLCWHHVKWLSKWKKPGSWVHITSPVSAGGQHEGTYVKVSCCALGVFNLDEKVLCLQTGRLWACVTQQGRRQNSHGLPVLWDLVK